MTGARCRTSGISVEPGDLDSPASRFDDMLVCQQAACSIGGNPSAHRTYWSEHRWAGWNQWEQSTPKRTSVPRAPA
ncbi:MAG TPA: hypothetical protein VF272_03715, partial [Candidatus Saccharimonadia bacterium]